jgi:hypothetical protein
MYRKNPTPSQRKEASRKESWWKDEVRFEIERLRAILRDPLAAEEEKAIAQGQIASYQEILASVSSVPSDWLRQLDLLGDVCEEEHTPDEWQLKRSA